MEQKSKLRVLGASALVAAFGAFGSLPAQGELPEEGGGQCPGGSVYCGKTYVCKTVDKVTGECTEFYPTPVHEKKEK